MSTAQERAAERRRTEAVHSIAYALCDHDENGDGDYGNDHLAHLIHAQLVADGHLVDADTARLVERGRQAEAVEARVREELDKITDEDRRATEEAMRRERRWMKLGEAVESCRPQDPTQYVSKTISYLFDSIYATAGVDPLDSASHRPPDSPARPETPPDGTPVPPEPSEGDVDAVAERVAQFAANLAAVNRISYADALHAIRSVLGEGGVSGGAG